VVFELLTNCKVKSVVLCVVRDTEETSLHHTCIPELIMFVFLLNKFNNTLWFRFSASSV
jgi:hypothetical protein